MSNREQIPLTKKQKEILGQFYSLPHAKVLFTKKERQAIEKDFANSKQIPALNLESICPAMLSEFAKAVEKNAMLQQAVFSECVYAQTLANMFGLSEYFNFQTRPDCLSDSVLKLIASYHLTPRYVYKSPDGSRALVQAGGNAGTDSALITIEDNDIYTIEFKEPTAKTSEPDIPYAYNEDGLLTPPPSFLADYPQFEKMLNEQINRELNFWSVRGTNVKDFGIEGIQFAISMNYSAKKYADVICVEDKNGYLAMMPSNQVHLWSETKGELRPVGRNSLEVWTPKAMQKDLLELGAVITNGEVKIPFSKIESAYARGSNGNLLSRFKFGKVYFVRVENSRKVGSDLYFKLDQVRQTKPTISAHMLFKKLRVSEVHEHYKPEI